MVGNIKRTIVALMLLVLMVPSCLQAMIITENTARGLGGVFGVLAPVCVIFQMKHEVHQGSMFAAGLFSPVPYLVLREYTPGQIEKRALEIEEEIKKSRIGNLVCEVDLINVDNINGISGSSWPCIDALQDTQKYELHLNKHIDWLKNLQNRAFSNGSDCSDVSTILERFRQYKKAIRDIRSEINKPNNASYREQLKRFEKKTGVEIEKAKIENEKDKTGIEASKVSIKSWALGLRFGKWLTPLLILAPTLAAYFVWSLKIPYPNSI